MKKNVGRITQPTAHPILQANPTILQYLNFKSCAADYRAINNRLTVFRRIVEQTLQAGILFYKYNKLDFCYEINKAISETDWIFWSRKFTRRTNLKFVSIIFFLSETTKNVFFLKTRNCCLDSEIVCSS